MPKGKERRVRGRPTEQHQTQRTEPIDEEPDEGVSILSNNGGDSSVSGDEADHGGGLNPKAPVGTHIEEHQRFPNSPRVTPAPAGARDISHFPEGKVSSQIPEPGEFSHFPGGTLAKSRVLRDKQSSEKFFSSNFERLPPPFSFHPLLLTDDPEDDINDLNSDSDDTMSTPSSTLNEATKIKPLQCWQWFK